MTQASIPVERIIEPQPGTRSVTIVMLEKAGEEPQTFASNYHHVALQQYYTWGKAMDADPLKNNEWVLSLMTLESRLGAENEG